MGLFDFFKGTDINSGVMQFNETKGAILIDVRSKQEFAGGHIPKAVNIPSHSIEKIESRIKDKDTPVFTYCLSGARSSKAASAIKKLGYTNVTNIGGINGYTGKVVR